MFIGTHIDGADSGGFIVTRRGRTGDNLATDKDGGRVEVVLGGMERVERDIN